jgi:hypothetical protein
VGRAERRRAKRLGTRETVEPDEDDDTDDEPDA